MWLAYLAVTFIVIIVASFLYKKAAIRNLKKGDALINAEDKNNQIGLKKTDVIRQKIQHENELINHRITWMILQNTLLLGAFGVMLEKDKNFLSGIIIYAIIIAVSGLISLYVSNRSIEHLRSYFKDNEPIDDQVNGIFGFDLRRQSNSKIEQWLEFFLPSLVIPIAVLLGWISLGIYINILNLPEETPALCEKLVVCSPSQLSPEFIECLNSCCKRSETSLKSQ